MMAILQAHSPGILYHAFDLTIANDARNGLTSPNGIGKSPIGNQRAVVITLDTSNFFIQNVFLAERGSA
jgi:hypothetical protein